MHPSATWAGVSLGRLLELSAAVIAALNPTLLIWSIVLVIVITVAVNSTIKRLAKRKPAVPRDIASLASRGNAATVTKAVAKPARRITERGAPPAGPLTSVAAQTGQF
jgi:hypothetical protein